MRTTRGMKLGWLAGVVGLVALPGLVWGEGFNILSRRRHHAGQGRGHNIREVTHDPSGVIASRRTEPDCS